MIIFFALLAACRLSLELLIKLVWKYVDGAPIRVRDPPSDGPPANGAANGAAANGATPTARPRWYLSDGRTPYVSGGLKVLRRQLRVPNGLPLCKWLRYGLENEVPGLMHLGHLTWSILWLTQWPSSMEVLTVLALLPAVVIPVSATRVLTGQDDQRRTRHEQLDPYDEAFKAGPEKIPPVPGPFNRGLLNTGVYAACVLAKLPLLSPLVNILGVQDYLYGGPESEEYRTEWTNLAFAFPKQPALLGAFPAPQRRSRVNAEVTAYMAMAAYEDWTNLYRRIKSWPSDKVKAELVAAWTFKRSTSPSYAQAGCFLVQLTPKDSVSPPALVLSFQGTAPLSASAWMTDFLSVAADEEVQHLADGAPYGFTHPGFRAALGLKPDLGPEVPRDEETGPRDPYSESVMMCPTKTTNGPSLVYFDPSTITDLAVWDPVEKAFKYEKPVVPMRTLVATIAHALGGAGDGSAAMGDQAQLFVTGHSAGAAFAAMFGAAVMVPELQPLCPDYAADLQRVRTALAEGAVYAYAQPRIGGPRLGRHQRDKFQVAKRGLATVNGKMENGFLSITNTNDIVPRVPPALDNAYDRGTEVVFLPCDALAPSKSHDSMPMVKHCFGRLGAGLARLKDLQWPYCETDVQAYHPIEGVQPGLQIVTEQSPVFYTRALLDSIAKLCCTVRPAVTPAAPWVWLIGVFTRLAQLLGGFAYVGFMLAIAVPAWTLMVIFMPLLLPLVVVDIVVVGLIALHAPVLLIGWVDHSMYDYYLAMAQSRDVDWL